MVSVSVSEAWYAVPSPMTATPSAAELHRLARPGGAKHFAVVRPVGVGELHARELGEGEEGRAEAGRVDQDLHPRQSARRVRDAGEIDVDAARARLVARAQAEDRS